MEIPEDIRFVQAVMIPYSAEAPDDMTEELREWHVELNRAVREWRAGGPEPDWDVYRQWMNDIQAEDMMPWLFDLGDSE